MQPYCRSKVKRGDRVEECGRALDTEGRCDRVAAHVEPDRIPAPGAS